MCLPTYLWRSAFFGHSSLRKASRKPKILNRMWCYCCFYLHLISRKLLSFWRVRALTSVKYRGLLFNKPSFSSKKKQMKKSHISQNNTWLSVYIHCCSELQVMNYYGESFHSQVTQEMSCDLIVLCSAPLSSSYSCSRVCCWGQRWGRRDVYQWAACHGKQFSMWTALKIRRATPVTPEVFDKEIAGSR